MFDQLKRAVKIGGAEIALDFKGGDLTFISHAHSDHAHCRKKAQRIICSDETAALIGEDEKRGAHPGVVLLDAGHMLGAKQLQADADGGVFVYTGDFNLEKSLTAGKAEIPKECDALLLEGTYGEPNASFPKREAVFSKMERWVRENLCNALPALERIKGFELC